MVQLLFVEESDPDVVNRPSLYSGKERSESKAKRQGSMAELGGESRRIAVSQLRVKEANKRLEVSS